MEQPTTPEQLADNVVKEWRRRYLLYPTRQTAGALAQVARDMALLPAQAWIEQFTTSMRGLRNMRSKGKQ